MVPSKLPDQAANVSPASLDDSDLITACLTGDEQAWLVLLERYSRLIYSIPLRFGLPKSVADEIFQETCLILLEKLNTLRDREHLSSWLITVTRRGCIQRWRRKDIETVELQETNQALETTLEEVLLRLERQHLVQRALTELSPRCQQLLKALFFADPPPSYEEIAGKLAISTGSIGPTRARCLEKLRQQIVLLE